MRELEQSPPRVSAAVAGADPGLISLHAETTLGDGAIQLLAVVEWDVGPRVSTELVDVKPGDIRIGMRVAPVFCDVPGAGITLLRYRPANV